MKNTNSYLLILLLLFFSCSSDEKENIQLDPEVLISFEDITPVSAVVKWEVENITNPIYSLYLDDVLLIENFQQNEYELNELNANTTYEVTLKVTYENNTIENNSQFVTTEPVDQYLTSLSKVNGFDYRFVYNDMMDIKEWGYLYSGSTPYAYGTYTYDNSQRLTNQYNSNADSNSIWTEYLYDENFDFSNINIVLMGYNSYYEFRYNFNEDSSYLYEIYSHNYNGPLNLISSYECEYSLDSNNRIITFKITDTNTNIEKLYNFEYLNDNITKIETPNQTLEISYDNYNNYLTYKNGFHPAIMSANNIIAGLLFLPNDIKNQIGSIPFLFFHRNKNNPVEYKLNGSIYKEFTYEYDYNNYPFIMNSDDIIMNFEYVTE